MTECVRRRVFPTSLVSGFLVSLFLATSLLLTLVASAVATAAPLGAPDADPASAPAASVAPGTVLSEPDGTSLLSSTPLRDNAETRANLVLVVTFKDSVVTGQGDAGIAAGHNAAYYPESNAGGFRTHWDAFVAHINTLDLGYIKTSVRDYLRTVSGGRYDVASYFPQSEGDGRMSYLALPNTASSYVGNDDALIRDIASAFASSYPDYDPSVLDTDSDGYIDNLMIIAVVTKSETFVSHESYSISGASLTTSQGGKRIGSYNLVEDYLSSSPYGSGVMDWFSPAEAAHEYLHTLDARDYYRNTSAGGQAGSYVGDPVGAWDIMAQTSGFPWPLAVTREAIGWGSVPEVNPEGRYTLHSPALSVAEEGEESGLRQAIKVSTPLSASEYFVIEYRAKSATGGYDASIGGSGFIVYRVNEEFASEGNVAGNDYVYVFRPNETGMTNGHADGAGDVTYAQVSTAGYRPAGYENRTTIGSIDLSKTLADGALCYSDGSNSGLVVTAVSQTDDSVTLEITHADYASAGLWMPVTSADGSVPFGMASSPSVDMVTDGTNLYMASQSSKTGRQVCAVWKHDGASWSQLGSSLDLHGVSLEWHAGSLYAFGISANRSVELRKWSGSTWDSVGGMAVSDEPSTLGLAEVGGTLYALVPDFAKGVCLLELKEGRLQEAASPLEVFAPTGLVLSGLNGQVLVAVGDTGSFPWRTSVYVLDGGTWVNLGSIGDTAASIQSAVSVGTSTYVLTYTANQDAFLTLVEPGEDMESVLVPAFSSVLAASLASDESYVYLSVVDGYRKAITYALPYAALSGSDDASAESKLDVTALDQLGSVVYASADGIVCAYADKTVYCAVADAGAGIVGVRFHEALGDESSGDGGDGGGEGGGGSGSGDDDDGDEPVSISSATIAPIPDQTYTGKAITPKPTVTLAGRALREGSDYTLSYRNNVGVGTATVTVSGRGAYTGSKSAEFEIVRKAASVKRLAGDTALDTMAKIAAQGFAKGSCDTVVVATMGGYWDALAASSLAGLHGCPVLLTSGSSLSDQAASEIGRLGARRAYIAGGAAAVSKGVESQIRAMGLSTERLAGDTAVGTAVEIYEEGVGSWGRTAVVATAQSYHDALAASPYAYAHAAPVFLTDSANELSADALAAVEAGGFESVVICGGKAAVSGSVEGQLKAAGVRSVRRLSGDTAYETAAAVSAWALANGMSAACVGVATGRDYYDALTGASLCGRLNAPLVLVGHGNASAAGFLRANRADVSQVYVFGGTAAVTADEYKQVQGALR